MRLSVLAVGTRMPSWVDAGFADYARRMPRELPLALIEIRPEPRTSGKPVEVLQTLEAQRLRERFAAGSHLVVLDERGEDMDTAALARRLDGWRQTQREVTLVIGGPDGLAADLKAQAAERLRLSSLTLPHGLARVLLAEALYRAASVLAGHPYHRP